MITREDVVRTVRAALVDDAGMPASWFPDEGDHVTKVVTDAVMLLLTKEVYVDILTSAKVVEEYKAGPPDFVWDPDGEAAWLHSLLERLSEPHQGGE